MTLIRRSGARHRSPAGVLADIAHELSSTSDWSARVQDALSMLYDVIPAQTAALGIQLDEWTTYYSPEPDDPDELADTLQEHFALLTGRVPSGDNGDVDWVGVEVISEGDSDTGSFMSLPVIGAGQVIGVLHVCVDEEDAYSPDDVSVLSIVAMQIGSYVKNIQAHEEAEVRTRDMERLRDEAELRRAEVESLLMSTPDGVLVFSADGNVLMMNEAGKSILGGSLQGRFSDWAEKLHRHTLDGCPMSIGESAPMRAMRGETIKELRYRLVTPYGKEVTLSISASPIRDAEGDVARVVCIFHDISEEVDLQERSRELFEREHHIAQMLQQALIPPEVEYDTQGVRIAVRYQPALKEAEIGGDFYDVFKLDEGRIGILIGDVAGKGLHAAIRVAAVRYSVRSYAYLDSSPGVVMTLVNELLCRDEPGSAALMTAVYAVLDTSDYTFTYASGGHEPPLRRKADGHVQELPEGGRALGVFGDYTYTEISRRIASGETIVIVTDGITEARRNGVLFGSEAVIDLLRSHPGLPPAETADLLLHAATEYAGGSLQDDAAIVVLDVA